MIFLNTNILLNLNLKDYVILVEIVVMGAWEPQSQVGLRGHISPGGQAGKQKNILNIFIYCLCRSLLNYLFAVIS